MKKRTPCSECGKWEIDSRGEFFCDKIDCPNHADYWAIWPFILIVLIGGLVLWLFTAFALFEEFAQWMKTG
jgi:hypothetical protein